MHKGRLEGGMGGGGTFKDRLRSEVERGEVCKVAEAEEGVSDAKEGAGVADVRETDDVGAKVDADAAERVPGTINDAVGL
jgi:hypothetical protein